MCGKFLTTGRRHTDLAVPSLVKIPVETVATLLLACFLRTIHPLLHDIEALNIRVRYGRDLTGGCSSQIAYALPGVSAGCCVVVGKILLHTDRSLASLCPWIVALD